MYFGRYAVLGVMFLLLINLVNAESFSVDPCDSSITITQDTTKIYMSSACFDIELPKDYNQPLFFHDKYNDDDFMMKVLSLIDVNEDNPAQKLTTSLPSLSLSANIVGNTVEYVSSDGKTKLFYFIDKGKIKAGLELQDWTSNYANGKLVLRTLINREEQSLSHFESLAPVVDGVTQPISDEEIVVGVNKFLEQTLFTGESFSLLVVDPLYAVDYSPNPAVHLIDGDLDTDSESQFGQELDITSEMTDNLTNTSKEVVDYDTYYLYQNISTTGWESGTFESWNWTCAGIDCDGGQVTLNSGSLIDGTYTMNMDGGTNTGNFELTTLYKNIPTDDYFNITLSYKRYCVVRESADWFAVQVSADNGSSYETLTNFSANSPLTTVNVSLDSQYSNNSLFLVRFVSYANYFDDECYFDTVIISGIDTSLPNQAISGRWSQTYNDTLNWWLRFYKPMDSTQNFTIYAYNNSDDLSDQFTWKSISGFGYFNINVTDLMDYMTNTVGLSFSQLRFWSDSPTNISDFWLRAEFNDTENPAINDYNLNDTTLDCLQTVRFNINATDNFDVDSVVITMNGTNYSASQHDVGHWIYDFTPTGNKSVLYDWEQIIVTDIVGLQNTTDPNLNFTYDCVFEDFINITHTGIGGVDQLNLTATSIIIEWTTSNLADSLVDYGLSPASLNLSQYSGALTTSHSLQLTSLSPNTTYFYSVTSSANPNQTLSGFNFSTPVNCTEDWQQDAINCLINDTYLKTYTDQNACGTVNNTPVDNGTYQSCNYCSESITNTTSACIFNGTGYFTTTNYTDTNYIACCLTSGLISDCSIDFSPYNESLIQSCTILNNTMTCDGATFEEYGYFEDRVEWICYPPENATSCISYIKDTLGGVVQTNPFHELKSASFISFDPDYEERTYFTAQDGLVTVYFTKENLQFDERDYIYGVKCSDGNAVYTYEEFGNPEYEAVSTPTTRWFWIKENVFGIIFTFLLFIILFITILIIIRKVKYG